MGLELEQTERGRGYWKLNTSHLTNIEYVKKINLIIRDADEQLPHLNLSDKWEMIKKLVRKESKKFAQMQSTDRKIVISQLAEQITHLEDNIESLNTEQIEVLEKSRIDLDVAVDAHTKGIMFRSKARWQMEGEKNTRYFYNLEKARYNAKTCTKLINEHGQTVSNPEAILEMQHMFYTELYSADEKVSFGLSDIEVPQVRDNSPGKINDDFKMEELSEAIAGLKNGSCPGSDGLPAEWYKVFWNQIKTHLHAAIMYAYTGHDQILHPTARTGILNLIPKGEKDTRYLKNMRPITLLNTDYKIIEKAIANRMVPALVEIIHDDQRGFLPDRKIAINIRKILNIVLADTPPADGMILSCDYMKCFDRVETNSITESMSMFGFSPYLIKWVKIIYNKFQLRIQNNGHFSDYIQVTRSVRQGGPASNALFLVVAEILAIILRGDNDIKGISLREIEQLLNQYADDMDVAMEHDQGTLDKVLHHINRFGKSTGFKLNYDKTTLYRVGSMQRSKAKLYTAQDIKWTDEGINVLGVHVCKQEHLIAKNYDDVINKAKKILSDWDKRNLSLYGKINVVNMLIASMFVYKCQYCPSSPIRM